MTILLTGSSGYIGSLLLDSWVNNPDINKIIAIDSKPPRFLPRNAHPKIHFIQKNIAHLDLEKELGSHHSIDAVVHTAYIIKTSYSKSATKLQNEANFSGLENILKFSLQHKIPKFIHFGTVASYGANPENSIKEPFSESAPLRENTIKYGSDKKNIEKLISQILTSQNSNSTLVTIFRIGSVSGPFLQNVVKKTGLMSFFRGAFPFIPIVNNESARQYIHEEDVVGAVNFILHHEAKESLTIFNLAAPEIFTFREIAQLLNKKIIKIPFWLAKLSFYFLWHLSLGKIPTPPGVINSYAYPIVVDGKKINQFGYSYNYSGKEALLASAGKFLQD
jgi:UDP-glucose 4-epimerase